MGKKTSAGRKIAAGLAALVAGLAVLAAGLSLTAAAVMLLVGMWHGHNDAVPALGFVDCVYGVTIAGVLGAVLTPSVSGKR